MTNTRLRKLTLILVLLVVALSASACLHKQLVYRSFDLENFESQRMSNEDIPYSGQAIFITNRIGNITVIGKDNPGFAVVGQYVSIEATISVRDVPFEETELNWEVDEDEIIIEAVAPEDIGKRFKWTPPFIEDKMAFFDITISVRVPHRLRFSSFWARSQFANRILRRSTSSKRTARSMCSAQNFIALM